MISPYTGAGGLPTSNVWTLVEARDCSASPAANQDFTNLGGYDELIVILDAVTASGASVRSIVLSDDNGVSFYTSGYEAIQQTGAPISVGQILDSSTSGTAAQYHFCYIPSLTGFQKMALSSTHAPGNHRIFNGSAARINAIRVRSASADTLNGGTIYVYARTNPWTLIGSNTSPAASDIDFSGFTYDELMLINAATTTSASANRRARYSVDSGSSFYSGASDYQREFTVAGAKTDWSEVQLNSADSALARTFHHHLLNTTGALKAGFSVGGREDNGGNDPGHWFKASSSQINGLRLSTGVAATINGGGIYAYGRNKPWTLVEARDCSASPAANQDFTGLAAYEELLIAIDGVGASASAARNLQFSVNNGSTFYSSSGDYYGTLTGGGGKTDKGDAYALSASSSAARYGLIHVPCTTGVIKPSINTGNGAYAMFVASSSQVNAIRVTSSGAPTLNSGTIYVYAR